MRLFHGSVFEVRKPLLHYGRKTTDFGKGFYTTTQREQAEQWARIKRDRAKADKAVVSEYEIADEVLDNPELNIRRFSGVDESWLEFVVNCRKAVAHDYDLVFGPVADDNVFATVNLYESGVLDAPAAIAQLRAYKTYDQLSFHTARVIGALQFVRAEEVEEPPE